MKMTLIGDLVGGRSLFEILMLRRLSPYVPGCQEMISMWKSFHLVVLADFVLNKKAVQVLDNVLIRTHLYDTFLFAPTYRHIIVYMKTSFFLGP